MQEETETAMDVIKRNRVTSPDTTTDSGRKQNVVEETIDSLASSRSVSKEIEMK